MRMKARFAGLGLLGLVCAAHGQTSPYSSMAIPGTHNTWNTTPSMTLVADNTWIGTQTLTSASGEFKFAANGGWTVNWGGNASIARVPGRATAPDPDGGNLSYSGLTPGNYRFTFNDFTLEFQMEWVGASPLPLPSVTNLAVVGDFNDWTAGVASMLTNHLDNTNIWSGSILLETNTAFQFLLNGNDGEEWGLPSAASLTHPIVDEPACGTAHITLSGIESGFHVFTLNVSNATFSVISTQSFAISTVAVQGNFIGTNNPPGNMMRIKNTTLWESEHFITNTAAITLRFSANQNVYRWGATNGTPSYSLPTAATMTAGLTNFATVAANAAGRYRITFNHLTGEFTLKRLYTSTSGINLVLNPGFETTTDGMASDWFSYQSWTKTPQDGIPPHSGQQSGAIHAKFNEWDTDYASYSQTLNIMPGKTYRASAWVRVTPDWTASTMQIKMEWRNSAQEALGGDAIINFIPDTDWGFFSVEGTAPGEAVKAHLVILCSGAGTTGFMCVDDVELKQIPPRTQDFDLWGSYSTMTPIFAPDGWSVTSGKTVYNIPPGRPPAGVFISQYVEGTGNNKAIEIYNGTLDTIDLAADNYILQQYNNGSTSSSTNISLTGTIPAGATLVVTRPFASGPYTNYPPDPAITSVPYMMTNKGLTFNGDDVIVLKKGNPFAPPLDRVGQVGTNATGSIWSRNTTDRTLTRKSTVWTGTLGSATAAWPLDDWIVSPGDNFEGLGTHAISFVDPNEPYTPAGYSLLLNTNHTLLSGELSGGIGDISFWYRTESPTPPIDLAIETAEDEDGPWTLVDTLPSIATTNFHYAVFAVNSLNASYARFRHVNGGTNRFRLDEIVISEYSPTPRLETFVAWTLPSYIYPGTYSRMGWTIQNASIDTNSGSRAALLDSPDSAVLSPAYSDGVGEVVFKATPVDTNQPAHLILQSSIDGGDTWITQRAFSVTAVSNNFTWLYLTNSPSQIRIGFNPGRTSGDVYLDDIEVRLPVLYRNQDFNSWPARSSYTTDSHHGWHINSCMVDAEYPYDGNSARLSTSYADAWIQSPYLPDGIGSISFRVAKTTTVNPIVAVEISSNGVSWTQIAAATSTVSGYTLHSFFYSDTSNHFVRLRHSAGNTITPVDDIRITLPRPRPSVAISHSLDPAYPTVDDSPYITADVTALDGAAVLSVTGYYKVGLFGPEVPVVMSPVAFGSYTSSSPITGILPEDAMIRSWITVRYAGIGAAPSSTSWSTNITTTDVLTNYVSEIPRGHVWINEISYYYTAFDEGLWDSYEDHEYIELCGVAGTTISNWSIELAFGADADIAKNGGTNVYASYAITNTFSDNTNGFGFFVLGDSGLLKDNGNPIDQTLTIHVPASVDPSAITTHNHMHNSRGVIRLLNEHGRPVYVVSYNGSASGALPSGSQPYDSSNSVSLRNTGSTYDDFLWGSSPLSIGAINGSQTLIPLATNAMALVFHRPDTYVDAPVINSNMRSPLPPVHSDDLYLYYGFAASAGYGQPAGSIHYRDDDGIWKTVPMAFLEGSQDSTGNVYCRGTITNYANSRGSIVQYVIEAQISKTGIGPTFIGADPLSTYALFDTLAAAKESPFIFTNEVPSIFATSFAQSGSNWVIVTDGNDPIDPFLSFKIYSATSLFVPLSQWKTNTFTTTTDYLDQITFTVPINPTNPVEFIRFDPVW